MGSYKGKLKNILLKFVIPCRNGGNCPADAAFPPSNCWRGRGSPFVGGWKGRFDGRLGNNCPRAEFRGTPIEGAVKKTTKQNGIWIILVKSYGMILKCKYLQFKYI